MRNISFVKMQGTGNDFVLIDTISQNIAGIDIRKASVKLCDRHYGIGADGVILVRSSNKADFNMQIINSDGSEAETCGNGIRCFARYVWERSIVRAYCNTPVPNNEKAVAAGKNPDIISVETGAGINVVKIIHNGNSFVSAEVDMGPPLNKILNQKLEVEDKEFNINVISMGNPHCVIFVDDLEEINLASIGPIIESLPQFPNRTNVEFARIVNTSNIDLKVWERGAGITLACGTGACATTVAAAFNKLTEKRAIVHLQGGDLEMEITDNGNVLMRGPAEVVFEGNISI